MWRDDFEERSKEWSDTAKNASRQHPLKVVNHPPKMEGITKETAKWLQLKSLKWILFHDEKKEVLKGILKHPLKYCWNYFISILKKKSYEREGDFFLYGLSSLAEMKQQLTDPQSLFVLGFSYCHKPFECPSGRFTDQCAALPKNPICQQCTIGKICQAADKKNTHLLFIPTVHYIGGKIFEIVHTNKDKRVIFLITACEMTLKMFGDFGNMVGILGAGVRLEGRICNTMKAFELSERGIKPGLTSIAPKTEQIMIELIAHRNCHLINL